MKGSGNFGGVKNFAGKNPGVVKWVVIVLLVFVGLKMGGKLLKGFMAQIKSLFGLVPTDEELAADKEEKQKQLDDLMGPIMAGIDLPRADSYYKGIADTLHSAMSSYGTDFELMKKKLENLTADELCAVYDKFDIRQYNMGANENGDLFQWFSWELTSNVLVEFGTSVIGLLNIFGGGGKTEIQQMRDIWKKAEDNGLVVTF